MAVPKVVIIGGGVSGLVALRHLKPVADVTLLEGRSCIGGLWSKIDESSPIDRGNAGNVYEQSYGYHFANIFDGLTMNIPRYLAQYEEMPHCEGSPFFLSRDQFYDYVKNYVAKFKLMDNVKLNTFVTDVRRAQSMREGSCRRSFEVLTTSLVDDKEEEKFYADFVVVANGHNSVPDMPTWHGLESFPGQMIHSRDYRVSDQELFTKKRILLVGASYSGFEMLVQFFGQSQLGEIDIGKVYFCGQVSGFSHSEDMRPLIESGKLVLIDSTIEQIEGAVVMFKNDEKITVDTIVLCTGYIYKLPFLKNEVGLVQVSEDGKSFGPLYKKTFCINEPHLSFLGNVDNTCFIQKILEVQAVAIKNMIMGIIELPSKTIMMKEYERELLDFSGIAVRRIFRPDCAGAADNQIIKDLSADFPQPVLSEDRLNALNALGAKLVEVFSSGDFIRFKKMDYRKALADFPWDA